MAANFNDYADGLQKEVVSEMAERFFGLRRELEEEIVRWNELVNGLKPCLIRLCERAACLHFLLFDDEGVAGFYSSLGVPSEPYEDLASRAQAACIAALRIPLGFRLSSRYMRLVESSYDYFQKELDAYLNGVWSDDPVHPGRKRITPHLSQIKELAEDINRRVAEVNAEASPSCALRYVRGLNPAEMERREMTGAILQDEQCGLDVSMAFQPVDVAALDFPEPLWLPPFSMAKDGLARYVRRLATKHESEVRDLFTAIRRAARNRR